jgi:hypothetical protein
MPTGQYSLTDVQAAPPMGQFSASDIADSTPPSKPSFWMNAKAEGSPAHAADEVAQMLADSTKALAKISSPNVMYEVLRKNFPKLGLKPILGMPTDKEVINTGLPVLAGGLEGGEAEGAAAPKVEPVASHAASIIEHPAVTPWISAMKRELMKIPGMDVAKTALESAKGLSKSAPEPAPTPAPIPQTNGVPWGSKIPETGPPELWGKPVPATAPPESPFVSKPQPTAPAVQPAPATPISPVNVEKALNDALGGRPLQRGVPLRDQMKAGGTATTAKLPEGFTPVDSTALKGFKYDPDAREFESITQGNQHYIHGDVSPEEAQAFTDAESKGK